MNNDTNANKKPSAANDNSPEGDKEAEEEKDYQLIRAIDLLRGVILYGERSYKMTKSAE